MAPLPPRIIDCTQSPDLLAGLPVAAQIRQSETAAALIADLEDGWIMGCADLDGAGYLVDGENRVITLDTGGLVPAAIMRSVHFQNTLTLRAFGALRAAWQAERLADARNMHRPDLWPLLGRIIRADGAVMTVRMAFEAHAEGDTSVWRHLMGDDCGDMAACYARTLERRPFADMEEAALAHAFTQWFERDSRVSRCDLETLSDMDAWLPSMTMEGRGQIGEGAIRCLTIDPVSGSSFLGPLAGEIAGNPAWRSIDDPIAQAHFLQVMDEVGATRIGNIAIRDKKLAARLFPEMMETISG